ncbi:hypothetical protein [Actinoplanes teichomyceticus]|uniref:Uncharacterized protein n=1 Tax=Actinoplanes teichomyceticus TaxID=1867 RepID=A0A561WNR3_ACTTI|nr:hypothetical protein [Actinoplanes teichomyceticus]TWG25485.1 hypothetical protein FHX34_101454 [Actinoplanes teichomyceticus]GIF10554.1 hypothetical protein Ate01nite_05860 [Actinoplanes teichomyceticus]
MSDVDPEQRTAAATADGAVSADDAWAADEERPEEAHGGSMAPGLVTDTGEPVGDPDPGQPPS